MDEVSHPRHRETQMDSMVISNWPQKSRLEHNYRKQFHHLCSQMIILSYDYSVLHESLVLNRFN